MTGKCRNIRNALIVTAFTVALCLGGHYHVRLNTYAVNAWKVQAAVLGTQTTEVDMSTEEQIEPGVAVDGETIRLADLTDAFDVILSGATKEFIAGYMLDQSFLMWLAAEYGDETVIRLASGVLDGEANPNLWYDCTGNSIHVLWLKYCQATGFQNYQLKNVYWMETADESETVLAFAGDFNFAKDWCTTDYMEAQPNGIYDCFSEELLHMMQAADILLMNNEFTYGSEGEPISGKAYTFQAKPETATLLSVFGTDIVSLANNHVYDYGKTGLLATMRELEKEGIPYLGAGENIKDASQAAYFVANGRKIAIVSATEIERSTQYTKEATETEPGVLKTLDPERFIRVIEEADRNSDYVIAVVHWGTEGTLFPDRAQRQLAVCLAHAGADAIIGGHPHRLQGVGFVEGVPVAYSLGNFWFSDGTLYTTLAKVVISADGTLRLRYEPCLQKGLKTSLIVTGEEKEDFYHYLAAISGEIGIDAEGNVYDKSAKDYPAEKIVCDSADSETEIRGMIDNEGNAIDIVGNLK